MMNADIKQRWLAALRSGEYKQGERALRVDDKFCCLGVLCDLHAKETGQKWEKNLLGRTDFPIASLSYANRGGELPPIVSEWAGLVDEEDKMNPMIQHHSLSYYNDKGETFLEIANLIDENL